MYFITGYNIDLEYENLHNLFKLYIENFKKNQSLLRAPYSYWSLPIVPRFARHYGL